MTKPKPATTPPNFSTSLATAAAVPPVASTSSTISKGGPGTRASAWIGRVSVPYSSATSIDTQAAGSLFGFGTGTKPVPREYATAGAKIKPRASIPTTTSHGTEG